MEKRRVIVTGAARGVGRETARSLCMQHGAEVFAVSRDMAALRTLQEEVSGGPGALHTLGIDIAADGAVDVILDKLGDERLHGLVHNAGILLKEGEGYAREDLSRLFLVNVLAPLELTKALAGKLAGDPPGHVLHMGSMGGFQDSVKFSGLAAYSASKAAMACMAQCLAEEMKDHGVRSNCLALGAVDTAMLRDAFPGYRAEVSAEAMGAHVAAFVLEGHFLYNGKVLPVAVGTP